MEDIVFLYRELRSAKIGFDFRPYCFKVSSGFETEQQSKVSIEAPLIDLYALQNWYSLSIQL